MGYMLRVVLDTSVVIAGLRSRSGASNALLRQVATRKLTPLATVALFLEYEDVLMRPENRLATGLDAQAVGRFRAAFASAVEPVEVHFLWRPQLRDPADEMVLEAAINGQADALVTHNLSDFEPAATRLGLQVRAPGVFLEGLKR